MEVGESFRYARQMLNCRTLALSFFLTVALISSAAVADVRVVSDLDDTAKITNVGDPREMILNGLFSTRAFTGMRELYRSLANARHYGFDYLSGTPEILRFRIDRFLQRGGFPKGKVHLKPNFSSENLLTFKVRILREILEQHPEDQFIFVGDDTQVDFTAYDEIAKWAPERVLAIYIRKVTARSLPDSARPFLSAFDLAREEYLQGRLTVSEAEPVARAILSEKRDERIVPPYSYCPSYGFFGLDPQMEEWNASIDQRIQNICGSRAPISE